MANPPVKKWPGNTRRRDNSNKEQGGSWRNEDNKCCVGIRTRLACYSFSRATGTKFVPKFTLTLGTRQRVQTHRRLQN